MWFYVHCTRHTRTHSPCKQFPFYRVQEHIVQFVRNGIWEWVMWCARRQRWQNWWKYLIIHISHTHKHSLRLLGQLSWGGLNETRIYFFNDKNDWTAARQNIKRYARNSHYSIQSIADYRRAKTPKTESCRMKWERKNEQNVWQWCAITKHEVDGFEYTHTHTQDAPANNSR